MSKPAAFKKLQAKWYRKLKRAGFRDLEKVATNGDMGPLSHAGDGYGSVASPARAVEEIAEFYKLATWFLNEFHFASRKDRKIWEMFSEGKTYRDIAKASRLSVGGVHKRLKRLIEGPFQDYRKMTFHNAN